MSNDDFYDKGIDLTSLKAEEIVCKAFNGNASALYFIFNRIATRLQPSDDIPDEFLGYFAAKSIQLRETNDVSVLTSAFLRNSGRQSTHIEKVKMVDYLIGEENYTRQQAIEKVAEDTDTTIESIQNACSQWPRNKRRRISKTESPLATIKKKYWADRIFSKTQYQLALNHIRQGIDAPYNFAQIMRLVFSNNATHS